MSVPDQPVCNLSLGCSASIFDHWASIRSLVAIEMRVFQRNPCRAERRPIIVNRKICHQYTVAKLTAHHRSRSGVTRFRLHCDEKRQKFYMPPIRSRKMNAVSNFAAVPSMVSVRDESDTNRAPQYGGRRRRRPNEIARSRERRLRRFAHAKGTRNSDTSMPSHAGSPSLPAKLNIA